MRNTTPYSAPMLEETIDRFLKQHRIARDAEFLLAVSGGADSVGMLHAFKSLGLHIKALHCNFSLRGEESDGDELFVRQLCASLGVPLGVRRFDTAAQAAAKGISIEMAARELRYRWFREVREKEGMDYIAVAHHADDVAETVLINLCRGTGIRGIGGIRAVSGNILRPLLECSRQDILEYLGQRHLPYRTDSTNNTPAYVRNKIRHRVIPVFKEINPSFLTAMTANCGIFRDTEKIFLYGIRCLQREILEHTESETLIHIQKTLDSPAPHALLYETLRPYGFNKSQVRDILDSRNALPGRRFVAGRHILVKGRTFWRLSENAPARTEISIGAPGAIPVAGHILEIRRYPRPDGFSVPTNPGTACMDADKIGFPLLVRSWRAGDWFCPLGMGGNRKKLSDFFTDRKFSPAQKRACLLLCSEGRIAWVIGQRPDERFKITPGTGNILEITLRSKAEK